MSSKYLVKVPIYVSESKPYVKNLFGDTYNDMLHNAKEMISNFNFDSNTIQSDKRSKANVTGISNIEFYEKNIGVDKMLLLQITAYKSKFLDGYYENVNKEKQTLNENDKICSNTYFALLIPEIFNSKEVYWKVLLYEDPSKTNEEFSRIIRLVMNKVLQCSIRNVKEEKFMKDLNSYEIIDKIEINMTSLIDSQDDEPPRLVKYILKSNTKTLKSVELKNVPIEEVPDIINDSRLNDEGYSKKSIKFILNNKRVLSVIEEYKNGIVKTFEENFNYSFEVTEDEIRASKIFQHEYLMDRFKEILKNNMGV